MNYTEDYLKNICSQFAVDGKFTGMKPYGNGHINDTFAVSYGMKKCLLQRINHTIFTDVPGLMNNIVRITEHIRGKLKSQNEKDIERKVLTVVPAVGEGYYYKDENGNYWRMYTFIENARTYDVPESSELICEAAKAFGNFQLLLTDMPQPRLNETIPNFHNALKRLEVFNGVLSQDKHNRAKDAKDEISFLRKHEKVFYALSELIETGQIPIRVTHNDTKINNVLMDNATNKGICVIDIDTVMPGASLYDFGDIVRTCTTSADEDECDLSKVNVEMPRFEAVLRGYLSTAGKFLNKTEFENLILGSKYIILEQGMRFLGDYLDGDKYYKIHRQGHNLDRCRTQFKIIDSINHQEDEIIKLAKEIYCAG